MNGQLTGMCGVYRVAAELSARGFIASVTSRSARAADILVTDQRCQHTCSVQVKTNRTAANFWLVGEHTIVSDSLVYVLVNLQCKGNPASPEYFVVPSEFVRTHTVPSRHANSVFYSLYRKDILDCQDNWSVFGDPHTESVSEESTPD